MSLPPSQLPCARPLCQALGLAWLKTVSQRKPQISPAFLGKSKRLNLGACSESPFSRAFLPSPVELLWAKSHSWKNILSPFCLLFSCPESKEKSNPQGRKSYLQVIVDMKKKHSKALRKPSAMERVVFQQLLGDVKLCCKSCCFQRDSYARKYLSTASASKNQTVLNKEKN